MFVNSSALSHGDRGDDRPRRRAPGRSVPAGSSGRRAARETGFRFVEQRVERLDRLVQRGAAAGEGVAEADRGSARLAFPGRRVEGVVDVVELGLGDEAGRGRRPRSATSSIERIWSSASAGSSLSLVPSKVKPSGAVGPVAARDLEVLEAERRAVADPEGRVLGQRRRVLSSFRLSLATPPSVRSEASAAARRRAVSSRRRSGAGPVSIDSTTPTRFPPIRTSLLGPAGRRSRARPRPCRWARRGGRCWRCRRGTRRRARSAS